MKKSMWTLIVAGAFAFALAVPAYAANGVCDGTGNTGTKSGVCDGTGPKSGIRDGSGAKQQRKGDTARSGAKKGDQKRDRKRDGTGR